MQNLATILWLSVILQIVAVVLALRLIPVSGRALAWIVLSAAFLLMAARRAVSLLYEQGIIQSNWIGPTLAESIALAISVCMCVGVYLVRDIFVQRKRSDEQLRKLSRAVEQSQGGTLITDEAGRIEYANPWFLSVSGISPKDLLGQPLAAIRHPDTPESTYEQLWRSVRINGSWKGELAHRGRGEPARWDATYVSPVRNEKGAVTHFVVTLQDITETKEQNRRLEKLAMEDTLTGLPNRTLFDDRLKQAIHQAQRNHNSFALMIMDLDRFKEINDTLGHHIGDLILREIGPRLSNVLRKADTVARMGGDEFLFLLPDADRLHSQRIASKIAAVLAAPFETAGYTLRVGASIGIAVFPEDGVTPERLTRCADVAMYFAKRHSFGFAFYDPAHDDHSVQRLSLMSDLGRSIAHNELVLYFQPKLSLKSGEVEGFEALLRWRHNGGGLLLPNVFIPLAEQTGMIRPLTEWVVSQSFAQMVRLAKSGHQVKVAINISAQDFQDEAFLAMVERIALAHRINLSNVIFELTERTIMTDVKKAIGTLQRLADMGIRLSIDDFGTGYSSLEYLKRLPVHELKIDKSFVKDMTTDRGDDAIVRSTIDLGHNFGLKVVAEGVEDKPAWNRLRELGCDTAQGFLFSEPFDAANTEDYLARQPI